MRVTVKGRTTKWKGCTVEMCRVVKWEGTPEDTIRRALEARTDHGHPFWGEAVKVVGYGFEYERIIDPDNGEPEEWIPPTLEPFQRLKNAVYPFAGGSRYPVPIERDDPIELWAVIENMVRKSISEIIVCNKIQTIGEFRLVLAGQHVDAGVVEDEMGDLALSVDLARAIIAECQDKPTQATSTSYIDEYADLFSALLASVQTRTRQIIDTIERGQ